MEMKADNLNFTNIFFAYLWEGLRPELGMRTKIEYSGKYEYRHFFASKYG